MTETNNLEIIEEQNETVFKKKGLTGKQKVKRCPERWLDDGKYNSRPIDPDYFKKY